MLRRLLAVLALMSGLAAIGVPVEARTVAIGAEQQIEARQVAASVGQIASLEALAPAAIRSTECTATGSFGDFPSLDHVGTTVRVGIDRARE
ncbi:hypothetical protein [Tsuneonella mangrovi]|uniref:hypothetical protein n=1 Tax=Tsuneonella mangrovi TaxID=1982042 RepID=UPI0012372C5E|nr:hypothetical protein [Tsuneonella mangrovi]